LQKLKNLLNTNFIYFLLGVVCFLIFVVNIGGYDLMSSDEPRYAEVSREMMINHNWIIPHLDNHIYYEKPPLYFAVSAWFSAPIGKMTVTSARLPIILLASLLIGIFSYFVGKKLGKKIGLLSGAILATTYNFFWFAIRVNLDTPLIFCTTISLLLLYDEMDSPKATWRSYLAFILMGLGTLIKSPIALLPILIIIIYAFLSKKKSDLKRIGWLRGSLVYIIVVASWVAAAFYMEGYHYFKVTVLDQIVGYSTGAEGHPNPIYYYLYLFPIIALPWSIFVIPAFINLFKKRKELPDLVRFSLIWFMAAFLIFSLVGSKRDVYLLQLFPAFALLVAWYLHKHFQGEIISSKGLKIPSAIFGLILIIVGAYVISKNSTLLGKIPVSSWEEKMKFALAIKSIAWTSLLFGILYIVVLFQKKKSIIVGLTFTFSLGLLLLMKIIILPTVDIVKSERYIAQEIALQRDANQKVGLWGIENNDSGFIFYNGIFYDEVFRNENEVKTFLAKPEEKILVNTNPKWFYQAYGEKIPSNWQIKKYYLGGNEILIIKTKVVR
jgi:4-amino-4-deoxy-L-arabinose transferase-like glycosyltransferase